MEDIKINKILMGISGAIGFIPIFGWIFNPLFFALIAYKKTETEDERALLIKYSMIGFLIVLGIFCIYGIINVIISPEIGDPLYQYPNLPLSMPLPIYQPGMVLVGYQHPREDAFNSLISFVLLGILGIIINLGFMYLNKYLLRNSGSNYNVVYCSTCGSKLDKNSSFCPKCGNKIVK